MKTSRGEVYPKNGALTPERVDALRREYDVIPVVRLLGADTITPVAAFAALSSLAPEAFLLESVERGESMGRYSFIGVAPRKTLSFGPDTKSPVATLREELVPLRVWNEEALPPFFGGAVGFFGYGIAGWSERIPDTRTDDLGLPDATLLFFDQVLAFDQVRQQLYVVANIFSDAPEPGAVLLERANARLDAIVERLHDARVDLFVSGDVGEPVAVRSTHAAGEFQEAVVRAKEAIAAGEVFQIVLSQRWECDLPQSEDLTLYRALRGINPSPYMFLFRTGELSLVGSSPEMLVRVDGRLAET
ncbi:MAG: chorismate-binding protein, partial [Thermoanaerobaculia bacterium]